MKVCDAAVVGHGPNSCLIEGNAPNSINRLSAGPVEKIGQFPK